MYIPHEMRSEAVIFREDRRPEMLEVGRLEVRCVGEPLLAVEMPKHEVSESELLTAFAVHLRTDMSNFGRDSKPAVVLLHPGSNSERIWQDMVPLPSEHLDVHTPTLLGHRGGPAAQRRPVTLTDVFDSAERYLDEQGLDRSHLAGNSLGGAVAIELARRGRAATVCAISPAGYWSASDGSETRLFTRLRVGGMIIRLMYPVAPLVLKSAAARRIILRDLVRHGERLSASNALDWYFAEPMGCTLIDDALAWRYPEEPLEPLPCPITLAWAEGDRLVPAATCGRTARERLPGAAWIALPGVGHNAMVDDPGLVARTVLAVTGVEV